PATARSSRSDRIGIGVGALVRACPAHPAGQTGLAPPGRGRAAAAWRAQCECLTWLCMSTPPGEMRRGTPVLWLRYRRVIIPPIPRPIGFADARDAAAGTKLAHGALGVLRWYLRLDPEAIAIFYPKDVAVD